MLDTAEGVLVALRRYRLNDAFRDLMTTARRHNVNPLTLAYNARGIGPWLLDRAVARALANGVKVLRVNTNTVDHPGALDTYRRAGFQVVRREPKELEDPRVRWPDLYRWPPQ
jgi:hypothetical protein